MNNPNTEAVPGQILLGENNNNLKNKTPHRMIYIGPAEGEPGLFIGVMLSTSTNYSNIPIPPEFFEKYRAPGDPYPFPTQPTLMRPRELFKRIDWAPFRIDGCMTTEGLQFVRDNLSPDPPRFYEFNAETH